MLLLWNSMVFHFGPCVSSICHALLPSGRILRWWQSQGLDSRGHRVCLVRESSAKAV